MAIFNKALYLCTPLIGKSSGRRKREFSSEGRGFEPLNSHDKRPRVIEAFYFVSGAAALAVTYFNPPVVLNATGLPLPIISFSS
jgi:hypothetical protein